MSITMAAQTTNFRRTIAPVSLQSLYRRGSGLICLWWTFGVILLATLSSALAEPPLLFPEKTARIAIDPGHGGRDTGARGPTGLLEKDVCLELARKLALRLESLYQVTLTRSDDYQVELMQRTAIANQADADLLISLHTGAGFVHSARGISIYYHADTSQSLTPGDLRRSGDANERQQWERTQNRYQSASLALATTLKKYLDQDPDLPASSIHGAPLAVLEGADMPAVLIEIGHLTHPATEAKLAAFQDRERLTEQIFSGVQAFLSEQSRSRAQ
jgi:N-acetylmuramoyl-L-alanine amidase